MTHKDPELMRLLEAELERHLAVLERDPPDLEGSRRSLHALKGSVGLAGEGDLAATLARIERRLAEDDLEALRMAIDTVRLARDRIAAGDTATSARWPEPPAGLEPSVLDPSVRSPYAGEVGDRLAGIDEALGGTLDPEEAAKLVYRHVHTMKGAASSVGDELMAWFCHGLEDRLRSAKNPSTALQEVSKWRAVLGGLLDDPSAALRTLKIGRKESRSNAPRTRETDEPPRSLAGDEATIRVATVALDRVLERVDTVTQAQESVAGTSESDRAATLRKLRADLAQALRLIGPPRPWGAPAAALRQIDSVALALDRMSEDLEVGSAVRRTGEQSLRESLLAAKRDLYAMRQARLGGLFARLASAIEAESRRAGRHVVVDAQGGGELVDRRIVEQLIEPCLQLARNAVAHGIEPPAVRAARGKSETGTITIQGRRHGSRLHVIIEDDGAGVDMVALRERTVESGALSREVADAVPDDTLLGLLFLPGVSTRDSADLLAGRGIGLDIALAAVQRMAGAVRVSSRRGKGFRAVVEVPIESGLAKVLWVRAGTHRYALFASYVRRVEIPEEGEPPVPHLASCLEPDLATPIQKAAYVLELDTQDERVSIGVDEVGRTEEHLIRPLTPLLAAMGPFLGAIVRPGGVPSLALDAYALASRIRTQSPGGLRSPARPPEESRTSLRAKSFDHPSRSILRVSMLPPAHVEAMTHADIGDVLAIEAASFGDGPRAGGRLDEPKLLEELARPWARLWIARRDKKAVAFVLAWHVADELHVLDIATTPNARRTGLARRLMDHALDYARANAVRHMLLEVRRSNTPAIKLYRACGFFAMGLRPRYYPDQEDAVEMALLIDPTSGEIQRKTDEVRI